MLRFRFVDPKYRGRLMLGSNTILVDKSAGNTVFVLEDDQCTVRAEADFKAFCKSKILIRAEAETPKAIMAEKIADGEVPAFPVLPPKRKNTIISNVQ